MPKVGMEEIRKEQVIIGAIRCIIKKGFNQVSVKDIAAEAGVSTGIIYHYFRNKDDLLVQVLKYSFRKSHEQAMETVEKIQPFEEKLLKHIENINFVPQENPDFYSILLNFLGQIKYNQAVEEVTQKFMRNLRLYVDRILEVGVKQGCIKGDHLECLSAIIIGLGMGLGIQWTIDKKAFNINQISEIFKEMVLNYIYKRTK